MSLIYAHRTARGLAPENTLEGCAVCLALSVDVIDLDICMTRDQTLVVTHDPLLNPDLTRDSDGTYLTAPLPISSFTFHELQRFNVGAIDPRSPYAAYFPQQKSLKTARIPSLKETLLFLKPHPIRFQIEMKVEQGLTPPPKAYAQALYQLLIELNVLDRTEVQSFDFSCLSALQKLDASIQTSYVTEGPFSPTLIRQLGGKNWSPFEMDVTKKSVQEAHALGLKIIPWGYPERVGTEFHEGQIRNLIEWGVDGIITDRPDKVKECYGRTL